MAVSVMLGRMGEYWVCVRGDLTPEQVTELGDAGIAARDLRKISGGFGMPIQWQTLRTCFWGFGRR